MEIWRFRSAKTKVTWIGSKINSNDTLCKDRNLEWTKEPFSIQGITFTTHLEDMETLNFEPKILQIERDIKSWLKRHISPLGKITVIKSLLLPKLTHLLLLYLDLVNNG